MKLLLINPPAVNGQEYIREGRCMQKKSSWAALWMPLTLAYLASILRIENSVKLVDCQAEDLNFKKLAKIVTDYLPDFVICNTSFPTIKSDLYVLEIIKSVSPDIKTSIFGMYPTLMLEKVFYQTVSLDFSVFGEPEWTYVNLINSIKNDADYKNVKGLVYKDRVGKIRITESQNFKNNILDSLPFPARDLLRNDKYLYPLDNKPFTMLMLSRGCPYKCTFCNAFQYYGRSFRKRNVSSIITEIKECLSNFNIGNFLFWGESFTMDNDYANEILDAIIKEKLRIKWSTRATIDSINEELLCKMKNAGCTSLSVGIESFNQIILDNVGKGVSVNDINKAISLIYKSGIISVGHFIFGLPGDTEESIKNSIKNAIKSELDYAQFYCAVPYPNTPFSELAIKENWIESEDYTRYHLDEAVSGNGNLSAKEIKYWRKKAYFLFYLRLSVIFKTIKRIKSYKSLLIPFDFRKWI